MNPKKLVDKDETLGNIVKVSEILEYIVLAELMTHGPTFQQNLEQRIIEVLDRVGVNKGYLSQRTSKLIETGKVEHVGIDPEHRSRHFLSITEDGVDYLKKLMQEVPGKVEIAMRTYNAFETYMKKYAKMPLK
ncbi:PadR family transcriptional regulator [Cohnella sp. AR92]|uniref:PadR family transcriptional regulator n=1 Tax=Cohnella sp. AR92 TaxID=648716 RepID=UPI000F8C3F82|nr:PadR family transcriptional regulator [Cohnella sp. AR92]RUS44998.1 PadR family transcriptional regulator [Cohnella sp. AR92]